MKLFEHAQKVIENRPIGNEHDMRDILTELVESHESQRAVADMLGISTSYLNDLLHGRRGVSERLATRMGYKKLSIYMGEI